MTNEELKALIAENRRHAQERHERAIQLAKAEFPEVDVEALHVTGDDYEKRFHLNNREYIFVDTVRRYVWKAESQLGLNLKLNEDLGHAYQLVNVEEYGRTFVSSIAVGDSIYLSAFRFKTGDIVKGERYKRKLYTSAKGRYFEYHGKRVYI